MFPSLLWTNELINLQPCGSVRRVPTRIAVILGKRSLYNCNASRILVPSPLGLPIGFLSLESKSIEAGSTQLSRGGGSDECLHENKSRLYVVAELSIKSSRVENGEGTGMYTAGMGFIRSHSGSLCAIAPAYRCSSTVPKLNDKNIERPENPNETDHSQSLPPLKLRETLPCLFLFYLMGLFGVVVYGDPPMGIQAMVYNLQSFLDERCKRFFSFICLCKAINLFCDGFVVHG